MKIFVLKDKKIVIVNFIIIIALALFSGLLLQGRNYVDAVFGVITAFTILVFDNAVKNYKEEDTNRKKMLINIFTECGIYIIIYGLILLIFKVGLLISIKIITIQIFLLIYCISKHSVSKASYKKKVIFYILFFSILIGVVIYGINAEMNFIDIILFSTVSASSVSALFCIKNGRRFHGK